jgi:hypothetical protein
MEWYELKIIEIRALKGLFVSMRKEIRGDWIKLRNEEL